MNVLTTLLTSLNGVFGKGYLLSGLVPAAVVVLGWMLLTNGIHDERSLKSLIEDSTALYLAIAAVALGLVFYVLRTPVLTFLQATPGRGVIAWFRNPARKRWIRLKQEANERREQRLWELTVLSWPSEKRNFSKPPYVPTGEAAPAVSLVKAASARARIVIDAVTAYWQRNESEIDDRAGEEILEGLKMLYNLTARGGAEAASTEEILKWQELLQRNKYARHVLTLVEASVYRDWSDAIRVTQKFPEYRQIRPTMFGNRFLVLDDYALRRYGIETSVMLTRLWGCLEDKDRSAIGDAYLTMYTLLNLCIATLVLTVGLLVMTLFQSYESITNWDFTFHLVSLLLAAAFVLVASWFYRGAYRAFDEVEENVMRVIDLHRLDLIKILGYKRPANAEEEVALFGKLRQFYIAAAPLGKETPIAE